MSLELLFVIFIIVMSVILHEVAHGYVAYLCGDRTAQLEGRLSLNPIVHVDPFGTVILPLLFLVSGSGMLFGYAKPVPISPGYLRKWPRDYILVSIAGVATNLAIAGVLVGLVHIPFLGDRTRAALAFAAAMNIVLAVFNLIPIPPLDGSRAFRFLLPPDTRKAYDSLEQFGFVIIIVLLFTGVFAMIIGPIVQNAAGLLQIQDFLDLWFEMRGR